VCLGPIRLADAFILVGDHYQLPPLVKNLEAKEGGLDISLFKLLSEAQPQAVVSLEHQYRMCEEIMTLSNELIYSGRLKCGTPEVAKRALRLPDKAGLKALHRGSSGDDCQAGCWLKDLFAEGVKACFVDTDQVPAREEKKGDRTINPIEAELTYQVIPPRRKGGREVTLTAFRLWKASWAVVSTQIRSELSPSTAPSSRLSNTFSSTRRQLKCTQPTNSKAGIKKSS